MPDGPEQRRIVQRPIEEEMERSYIDYAMSVIVGRALPDVRDGLKPVHRRVLHAMNELGTTSGAAYKKSARIVGECFVAGTLVATGSGLVPIEQVRPGDQVFTEGGLRPVVRLYGMPPRPLVQIALENGMSVVATRSQKIRVLQHDLSFAWKSADLLEPGDWIALRSAYPNALAELPTLPPFQGREMRLGRDLAYALGQLMSDGYMSREGKRVRFGFNSSDRSVMERVRDAIEREFGYAPSIECRRPSSSKYKPMYGLRISRDAINEYILSTFDLQSLKAATKRIPDAIMRAPRPVVFAFISGLVDGDGSISGRRRLVHYGSVSRGLIDRLQVLLHHLGYHAKRYTTPPNAENISVVNGHPIIHRHDFITLEVTGAEAVRLASELVLVKQSRRERAAAMNPADRPMQQDADILPFGSAVVFQELSSHHLGAGWYQDSFGTKFRQGIRYPGGGKLRYAASLRALPLHFSQVRQWGILRKLERIGSPLGAKLNAMMDNGIAFAKVGAVEAAPAAPTYDIEVEGDHDFLANGIVAHNCMGKYHPHGDAPVYDSLVRMAQAFSLRYPLIQGQGNFGCFTGDTRIRLLDGRDLSFTELSQEFGPNDTFYIYSLSAMDGRITVGSARNPCVTRHAAQIMELVLDNGERICCTPDHRFLLRDGSYKQASELTESDSLMPGYFSKARVNEETGEYLTIVQPRSGATEFVHHIVDRWNEASGVAERFNGPYVRHHLKFNRFDNRPQNIERMRYMDHLKLHARHAAELWKDPEFRERQREAVKRYFRTHPEKREAARERFANRNRSPEFRRANGPRVAASLKARYRDNPHLRSDASRRMRETWANEAYRRKMSVALRGIAKRPLTEEQRRRVRATLSAKSRAMWASPKRHEIVKAIRESMANTATRERLSVSSRSLWKDPTYRAKFPGDHFASMAKSLWERPETREFHRRKMLGQRQDERFRQASRAAVRASNARRLAENPSLPKELAAAAAVALRQRWQDQGYRRRVVRAKVLHYVSGLLRQYSRDAITPAVYDRERWNNCYPRSDHITRYFDGFDAMLDEASRYNHRVVRKHLLRGTVDVWDMTVDVHHNFLLSAGVFVHNSVDGDPPAAMRYTEVRLSKIAEEMLQDIEKDTVDMVDNFDGTLKEPTVLPSKFPNLLVNGSSGIAVGMATNIPPHNLGEIVDALVAVIDNPDIELANLVNYEMGPIRGPDFPTGGIVYGFDGVWEAYKSGRGQFRVRGRFSMEGVEGDRKVVFTEIPYMVNKSSLLQSIAELVKDKRIDGVSDLRDESDREGIRIVIELKKDAMEDVVLNQLFAHTALQSTFGVINLSLVDGAPRTLPLKDTLQEYVRYREHVVRRRTQFDLNKARAREHIVEGLITAVDHLDEVITLIRRSRDTDAAREGLMRRYLLSEEQVKAILDMRLQRLTGLAIDELREERRELEKSIAELEAILGSETRILGIIKQELAELKEKYGDPRRTDIVPQALDFEIEDIIPNEANVVTISNTGYVKRSLVKSYRQQRRAGKGVTGMGTKEEDFVVDLFIAYSHDFLLLFTSRGRLFRLKTYRIPEVGRAAKGKPVVNLLPRLDKDEHVQTMIPVREFDEKHFLVFATKKGVIKRTGLFAYRNVNVAGIRAINLRENDELIDVRVADGDEEILLATAGGYANRFSIGDVRPMGRAATGVRGLRLYPSDEVVAMTLSKNPDAELLTVLASGFGKRTQVASYRKTRRGSHGVKTTNMKIAKSRVVTVRVVHGDDALLVTTMNGMVIRCPVKDIRVTGRAAKGVRIMRVEDGDKVMAVARLISEKEEEQAVEAAEAAPPREPPKPQPQPEIGPPDDGGENDGEPEDVEPEGDEPEEL